MAAGTPNSLERPSSIRAPRPRARRIIIIQAKHTNGYDRHFAEGDFYNPKKPENSVLGKEVPRIKKLRDTKQADHYMLFAKRRLGGNADADITAYLASECGFQEASIYLCDVEQLELWLKQFPDVARTCGA